MSEGLDYQQVIFGKAWDLRRSDRTLGGLRLDWALNALEVDPNIRFGKILEVGCGVGRFTTLLKSHLPEAQLFACDLSQLAVNEASHRGQGVDYAVADAMALPYADGVFDAVVFFDLLEHLADPNMALAEFSRVMRPDGLLHGYIPCEGQPPTLHWALRHWVHIWTRRHAGHIHHYRQDDLLDRVKSAGFTTIDSSYSCHFLGQALDVTTFAVREMVFRRRGSESERPEAFYDRSVLGSGWLSRVYSTARNIVEVIVYFESRLLNWCPWSLGLHLTARRRSG